MCYIKSLFLDEMLTVAVGCFSGTIASIFYSITNVLSKVISEHFLRIQL